MSIALLLEMTAEGAADRIAFGSRRDGVSFGALLSQARAAAAWIADAHEQARTLVFVGLNSESFPVALFASALSARPFAPLNYRLPDADLRRILARTAPSLAIVDDDILQRVGRIEGVTVTPRSAFQALASQCGGSAPQPAEAEDVAILLFTSGTTGEPKAAMLRHRHLASYVLSTIEFLGAGLDEAALVSVPPYHIAGISAVLTSAYLGRRIVHLESFTPEDWVRVAVSDSVTHAMVVPTMLGRILDVLAASGERLPRLRHVSYGGGRMPASVIERALLLLPHVDFVNAYGLTETSSTISVLDPEAHREAAASPDPDVRRRLGSVGRPLPTLEVEIRGANEERLPPGVAGEIWVRGEQVSGEYQGRRAVRDDGWFPTNDSGWLDSEGFLYVDGRLDDVIVRGGENISPGEIEDVLREHPAVADIAVLGLPDEDWGERVVAVVVSSIAPDAGELAAWARVRLRSTRTPQEFHFRSTLPYNDMGKLLRRTLRADLMREANATERAS